MTLWDHSHFTRIRQDLLIGGTLKDYWRQTYDDLHVIISSFSIYSFSFSQVSEQFGFWFDNNAYGEFTQICHYCVQRWERMKQQRLTHVSRTKFPYEFFFGTIFFRLHRTRYIYGQSLNTKSISRFRDDNRNGMRFRQQWDTYEHCSVVAREAGKTSHNIIESLSPNADAILYLPTVLICYQFLHMAPRYSTKTERFIVRLEN